MKLNIFICSSLNPFAYKIVSEWCTIVITEACNSSQVLTEQDLLSSTLAIAVNNGSVVRWSSRDFKQSSSKDRKVQAGLCVIGTKQI